MDERAELLIQCRGLIIKLAVNRWKQSSRATKAWTSPDDFIEDCYLRLLTALKNYDGRVSPTTFVWHVVNNYFVDAEKFSRRKGRSNFNECVDTMKDSLYDAELRLVVLKEAMNNLYGMASVGLQHSMENWFSDAQTCINIKQRLFGEHAEEFRSLAVRCGINRDDCSVLLRSNFILRKKPT